MIKLTNSDSFPIVLDIPNETYILDSDIKAKGTAIFVAGPNITLDLNDHEITYGSVAGIIFTDTSFRSFEFYNAEPDYSVDSKFNFIVFKGPGEVKTHKITLEEVNRQFSASVICKGNYNGNITIHVFDAQTNTEIGQGRCPNPERGMSAVCLFTPKSDTVYIVVKSDGPSKILNIAVTPSKDYGVIVTKMWEGDLPVHLPKPANYRYADNFRLIGGKIRQTGYGYESPPIYCKAMTNIVVDNVDIESSGFDTHGIDAEWAFNVEVLNSRITMYSERVSNRMHLVSNINCMNVYGKINIYNNELLDSPQTGIIYSCFPGELNNLTIQQNNIIQNSIVTDGYGIVIGGAENFMITRNFVGPKNGRGILLDSWGRTGISDGEISTNYFSAIEKSNLEYNENQLEATALRIRPYEKRFDNIEFADNDFEATTGNGYVHHAIAARIDQGPNCVGNRIDFISNTFRAVGLDGKKATSISFSNMEPEHAVKFFSCGLESNNVGIALGDNDGWEKKVCDVRFDGIKMTNVDIDQEAYPVVIGDYHAVVSDCSINNMILLGRIKRDVIDYGISNTVVTFAK